jgi:phosphoglycolate phosphatase-like HAD superfamily hydrolase
MQPIEAILFDPVGSLAEFPSEEFEAIAVHLLGNRPDPVRSASRAYWDVVDALGARGWPPESCDLSLIEQYESQAIERAIEYGDGPPALAELKDLGVQLVVASSLSEKGLDRFLKRASLTDAFVDRWSRDRAGGVSHVPLTRAVETAAFAPERTLFLADTASGLHAAKRAGVQPILMMNDPDEAMTLTQYRPAGGIVSLHELPDFVRLVAANAGLPRM